MTIASLKINFSQYTNSFLYRDSNLPFWVQLPFLFFSYQNLQVFLLFQNIG